MRSLALSLSIAALALNGCAMTPAQTARAADERAAAQTALDKDLAGLTAVGTKDCLDRYQTSSLSARGPALVYTVSKGLVYVSQTTGGCEGVERGDILVTKSITGQLCRGDIATTVQTGSRTLTGSCALGSFTTYRKVAVK
jgi:hypothetical protein